VQGYLSRDLFQRLHQEVVIEHPEYMDGPNLLHTARNGVMKIKSNLLLALSCNGENHVGTSVNLFVFIKKKNTKVASLYNSAASTKK
jgi:hypothetical protein